MYYAQAGRFRFCKIFDSNDAVNKLYYDRREIICGAIRICRLMMICVRTETPSPINGNQNWELVVSWSEDVACKTSSRNIGLAVEYRYRLTYTDQWRLLTA